MGIVEKTIGRKMVKHIISYDECRNSGDKRYVVYWPEVFYIRT